MSPRSFVSVETEIFQMELPKYDVGDRVRMALYLVCINSARTVHSRKVQLLCKVMIN